MHEEGVRGVGERALDRGRAAWRRIRWGVGEAVFWTGAAAIVVATFFLIAVGFAAVIQYVLGQWLLAPAFAGDAGAGIGVFTSSLLAILSIAAIYLTIVGLKDRLYTRFLDPDSAWNRLLRRLEVGEFRLVPRLNVVAVRNPCFRYDEVRTDASEVDENEIPTVRRGADGPGEANRLTLSGDGLEIVYLRIKYNSGRALEREALLRPVSRTFRWWIEFPEGFRVLRHADANAEAGRLPDPTATSLYDREAFEEYGAVPGEYDAFRDGDATGESGRAADVRQLCVRVRGRQAVRADVALAPP